MSLTEYETTVVIRPDIGGDAVEATLDKVRDVVKNRGGKLLAINHWGKKKLAYDIAKHARGVYVHTQFLGGSKLVAELERNLRINDNVLRFLTIRIAQNVSDEGREEQEYVRPSYEVDTEENTAEGQDEESDASDSSDDDQDGADQNESKAVEEEA